MGPEARIRLGIRDSARSLGFAVWDMEQNRQTRQTPGFTDLVLFGWGWIIFCEVKTAKGRMSDAQKIMRDEVVGQRIDRVAHVVWRSTQEMLDWLSENRLMTVVGGVSGMNDWRTEYLTPEHLHRIYRQGQHPQETEK